MPNVAAHLDDDFGIEAPARKKAPRRASAGRPTSGKRKKRKGRFAFLFDSQRLTRYVAVGMSGTVVVGILVNALIMQKGHHPAPLFGKSITLGQSAAATPSAPPAATRKAEIAPMPVPRAEPAPATHATVSEDAGASNQDDPIGRLLQGGSASTERPGSKTVLGVQRALVKLGFTVKQTGTFGPQTRKAIERFERDHHLAAKGEVTKRLVKLLASESHLKIEP